MKKFILAASSALTLVMAGQASAASTTITFDEPGAVNGDLVGSFYTGVTFTDAEFEDNFGLAGTSGELAIMHAVRSYQPQPDNPIEATFDSAVSSVSLRAIDVGLNGAEFIAYDAMDNVVDMVVVFGTGVGDDQFFDLVVSGSSIVRVAFSQSVLTTTDGILFEDFSYTMSAAPVPVPAAALLFAPLAGLVMRRRRG